jgi:DNA-directed RNA polymerase specialized sigma24 family protein
VLTRLEQLSHAEVSAIMGISIAAIESLLHRARANLRTQLDKKQ